MICLMQNGDVLGTRQAHKATIFELICVNNDHNPFARHSCTIWAACMDSTVTLWNPSLTLIKKLSLNASSATSLVQVGNHVYIADAKQIFVFDSQTYDLVQTIDLPQLKHLIPCDDMFNGESNLVRSNTIMNLDTSGFNTVMSRSKGLESAEPFSGYFVRCMALVEKHVWVCTDGFICFIDSSTLSIIPGVCIPIPKINSIAYVKSTNQVWGGCSDCSIYIWDGDVPFTKKGKIPPSRHLSGWTSDRVSKLANHEDKYIFSGSWDKKIRVWDAQTANLIFESKKCHECPIMAIVILPYRWLRVIRTKETKETKEGTSANTNSTNNTQSSSTSQTQQTTSNQTSEVIYKTGSRETLPLPPQSEQISGTSNLLHPSQLHQSNQSQPTSTSTSQATPDLIQRSASIESHLSQASTISSTSSSSSNIDAINEIATILTVFTADWSSVSLWI
jgi:hypothetical protein